MKSVLDVNSDNRGQGYLRVFSIFEQQITSRIKIRSPGNIHRGTKNVVGHSKAYSLTLG